MNAAKTKPVGKSREKKENPYKGLHSYEESDKEIFYGRGEETEGLSQLVRFNFLSVVFGKAGIGKTSLLNAGVFPRLKQERFLPIRLRLSYSKEEPPLREQIYQTVRAEIDMRDIELRPQRRKESADPLSMEETLWEYFHRVVHFDSATNKPVTPLLVLDQFEEFFTVGKKYSDKHKDDLLDEFYWLVEDQCPAAVKERLLKGNKKKKKKELPFSAARPDVRLIISLREDYLPHFIGLKSRIASIDRNMFRVTHLNGGQAREIIAKPGRIKDETVINDILRLFYPDDVRQDKEIPYEELEVEPSILSLICLQIVEENFTQKDRDIILTRFYDSVMEEFPAGVGAFIEDRLLTEEGFRTTFRLVREHSLKQHLQRLVDQRIIRKVYLGEKEYIEIIHDVLAPIIKEKRDKRLDIIRKQKLKKILVRRLTTRIIAGAVIILAVVTGYALYQKNRADRQYLNAQIHRLTGEALLVFPRDATRAVRIAGEAFKMGLPNPPVRTYRALSDIGGSSFETPFYITALKHKESIYRAVFSPDGGRILTASDDGTARLWQKGKIVVRLKHDARVFSAVFSPDGRWILTASWDKSAKVWDLEGKPLLELKHRGALSSAVFSPDGRWILTASRAKSAKVWDLEGKPLLELKHRGALSSAVFSPDGRWILTASWDKNAKLWDMQGNPLVQLKHNKALSSAVFSPDSKRILTACEDGTARVWTLKGEPLQELKHGGEVSSAVFSPDGRRILTASSDKTAKVWQDGNILLNMPHDEDVSYAVFSPDGRRAVTASADGVAKVWELEKTILKDLDIHTSNVNSAVFSPDGSKILTASGDHSARVWDLEGNLLTVLKKHTNAVIYASFSPDGAKIITASEDGTAKVWNLEGELLADLRGHQAFVLFAAFSPDGSRVLTASVDRRAMLWDTEGKFPARLTGHTDIVYSAVFSPDGSLILTASRDKTVKIWSREGKNPVDLARHEAPVFTAVFSPDGKQILTASEDQTVKLWNLKGQLLADFNKYKGAVYSAVFSPDGRRILTYSEGEAIKLWDLEGNLLADLNKHKGIIAHAVFSPDGRQILTASRRGTVKLWYTPEAIYEWLKTAKIPGLSEEDREELGIR